MNGCLKVVTVVCILIVVGIVGVVIVQNVGVEHASRGEEQAVLKRLPKASAREVLDAFFWGINHHSPAVVQACNPGSSSLFSEVRCWQVISIKDVSKSIYGSKAPADRKTFDVKFKWYNKYLTDDPCGVNGGTLFWTFELYRPKPGAQWLIGSYGSG